MDVTRTVRVLFDTSGSVSGLTDVDRKSTGAGDGLKKLGDESDRLSSKLKSLESRLDAVAGANHKYSDAHHVLDQALSKGIISQERHNTLLGLAHAKYLEAGHSTLTWREEVNHLTEKIVGLTGVLGPMSKEAAEGLGGIAAQGAQAASVIAELGALAPLVIGLAAAVAGLSVAWGFVELIKSSVEEGMKLEVVIDRLNASLRSNGAAAGYSAHELVVQAESLVSLTGRSKEAIIAGEAILTRFHKIGHEEFPLVTKAALNLSQATGKDLSQSFEIVAKAMTSPERSLRALFEAGVFFDKGQRATLETMIKMGDQAGYQKVILDALTQSVGNSAESYSHTLGGGINIAREKQKEFKESIASEVIPALEDVLSSLVEEAGGWEAISYVIKSVGHDIGNVVRTAIYGVIGLYHEWRIAQQETILIVEEGLKAFFDFFVSINEKILTVLSKMPGVLGEPFAIALDTVKSVHSEIDGVLGGDIQKIKSNIAEHQSVIDKLSASLQKHRQALEGDTEVMKNRGDVMDDVASKDKKAGDQLHKAADAAIEYSHALRDLEDKLITSITAHEKLIASLDHGIQAYNFEKSAQERANAVEAVTIQLRKAHESEIQKLSAVQDQLSRTGNTADAAKIATQIVASNKAYEIQSQVISGLAGKNVDLKQAEDHRLESERRIQQSADEIRTAEAALSDAIDRKSLATQREADFEKIRNAAFSEGIPLLSRWGGVLASIITQEQDHLRLIKEVTQAQQEYNKIASEVELSIAVSNIDQSLSTSVQEVETRFLQYIQSIGKGSIEEGQRVFSEMAKEHGKTLDEWTDQVKIDLGILSDANNAAKFKGAGKTNTDIFTEAQDNLDRYYHDNLIFQRDYEAASRNLQREYYSSLLSDTQEVLGILAQSFGGFFNYLQKAVSIMQNAQTLNTKGGDMFTSMFQGFGMQGGSAAMMGGAAGGIMAEAYIWREIYVMVRDMMAANRAKSFGTNSEISMIGGNEGISYFNTQGYAAIKSIREMMKSLGDALGGVVTDFAEIGIKIRNDGKKFRAYVQGVFIGEFNNEQEAITAAITKELQSGLIKFKHISELVQQGIDSWTAPDMSQEVDWLKQLKEISDLSSTEGIKALDAVTAKFDEMYQALSKMPAATDAVIQGYNDINTMLVQAFESTRRSITGEQETPQEELARRQREALLFNARKALEIANLRAEEINLEAEVHLTQGRVGLTRTNLEIDRTDLEGLRHYVTGRANIVQADIELTNASMTVAEAQLAAIQAVITQLEAITDIDPNSLRINPNTGAGGGLNPQDQVRESLEQHRLSMMGEESRALAEINNRYHDLNQQAGHNKQLLAELAQARREEIEALAAQIRQRYLSPNLGGRFSGGRTEYARTLEEENRAQQDLIASHRQLGLAAWQINAAFTEMHRQLGLTVLSDLGLQSAQLVQHYEQEGQAINFLRSHMEELGISTAQLQADLQELSDTTELGIFGKISQYISDEKTLAQYKEIQYELDIARAKEELALAYASGAITLEAYNRLGAIIYSLPQTMPVNASNAANDNFASTMQDVATDFQQAAKDQLDAANKIKEWEDSLVTNPDLSPLSGRQQVEEAKRQEQELYTRALSGDREARDRFTSYADNYLKLFQSVFGRTEAYGAEARNVLSDAEMIRQMLLTSANDNSAIPSQWAVSGGPYRPHSRDTTPDNPVTPPPPPPPGPPGPESPAPIDPKVTEGLDRINTSLGPDGSIIRVMRDSGQEAIRYYNRSLEHGRGTVTRLDGLQTVADDHSRYLRRIASAIESLAGVA